MQKGSFPPREINFLPVFKKVGLPEGKGNFKIGYGSVKCFFLFAKYQYVTLKLFFCRKSHGIYL